LSRGPGTASLARTVVTGAGLLAVAGGIGRLFSLVSSPILTRVLGPSPYGVVALLGTVTSFATTAALLGVDLSYSRYFLASDPERAHAVERFCWRFAAGTALAASAAAGAAWSLGLNGGLPESLAVMVVLGTFLPAMNVMVTTRQRLLGSYGRIAVSIVVSGGVSVVLSILLALTWRPDAWAILVATAVGLAAGTAVAGLPSFGLFAKASGLPAAHRWEILRLGLTGVVTAPMFWVMNSADRWIIGGSLGQETLGIYAFCINVGQMGVMLNNAITLTWFPEMLKAYEGSREESAEAIGRMWTRLAVGLLVVWLAVTAAGGDLIQLLASPRFHEGRGYVPWMAGGVFFYGLSGLATTGHAIRMDLRPVAFWWIVAAAANVALNFLLVRPLGAVGGAVAACASFALLAAGAMASSQKRFRLPIPWSRLAVVGMFAAVAGAGMALSWSRSPLLSLAMKLPVGALSAVILFRVVAPDWVVRIWRKVVSRGRGGEEDN
jgi:O-antigen/teichoic acid export membrane protein